VTTQNGAGSDKPDRRGQKLAIIALAIIAASIVSILICVVLIGRPPLRAPDRDFDYADLLIVEQIAPSNWVVEPMSSGRADGDSYYDYYYSHQLQIFNDEEETMLMGYVTLQSDNIIDPGDFSDFKRYIYMRDGPVPHALVPTIRYAEQWDIGCEVVENLNTHDCDFVAQYQETIFHMFLRTRDPLRFDDLPEIMEQIAELIEAQDRHIGEMMGMTP
jgi:hypothetical protein